MKINLDKVLKICNDMNVAIGADNDSKNTICNLAKRYIIISPVEFVEVSSDLEYPIQEVADIIILHELGHFMAIDYQDEDLALLNMKEIGKDSSNAMDILYVENKAWEYAEELFTNHFPEGNIGLFKKIKKYALDTYVQNYLTNL